MASVSPAQIALDAAKLQSECTNLVCNATNMTSITLASGQDESNNRLASLGKGCISTALMLFWLLLAPAVLWVYCSFVGQHLEHILWVLALVESVISYIGMIVSALQPVCKLTSTILGYFGSIGGVFTTLAMTYFGHRYADKCQAGIDQAKEVYKTLSNFWKKVSPAFASVTDALSKWYIPLILNLVTIIVEYLLAGVGALIYTFVFVTPYIVLPLVMFGSLVCLKFRNFFKSWDKNKKLKAEYEKKVLAQFKHDKFDGQEQGDNWFLNTMCTNTEYLAYKTALEWGPANQKSNFARVVAFFACLKPLVYACLALVLVAYASPDFDVKGDVPFHVDIDKCWKHFNITDDDIGNIDDESAPKGWVHEYQACYDCASTYSTEANDTIWTSEETYFGCAEKRVVELNSTYHDSIPKNTVKPKANWLQAYKDTVCKSDDYSSLACSWLKTDTPSPPNDPIIDFAKNTVNSLNIAIVQLKHQCKADYVSQMKARAVSFFQAHSILCVLCCTVECLGLYCLACLD